MLNENDNVKFLTTASNDIEADIIKGLMEFNGIPVLLKFREAGESMHVYVGKSIFGIDIFVPSNLIDEAKELINSNTDIDNEI